ncbi:cbb3-type cytochrome c oxidase subunit I [Moorella sp. Hama-1]|uniref:cbb3-type cytochrome c oxidase subunit I n=1 Tax=Moorella sp. Hama-1 TaxID=2138101 RepID=UPI000D64267B|nr:cbb3-type cytochrome c oxidase subunit I [Moorella sp. Hama-1]BCV21092.1 cytochrome C and quinol oxidase polypeptide I [Moorella sp. Hama-1]
MIAFLIARILFPRRRQKKGEQGDTPSQQAVYPYALAVFLFLGFQGILATGGSLHLVFPDLPTPITFASGRAMHLNLSILWPLLGTLGSVYYFLVELTGRELYSPPLARWGFWYLLGVALVILGYLASGRTDGREYLEAPLMLKIALLTGLLLFAFNLLATAIKTRALWRPEVVIILSGAFLSPLLYLPTIFFIANPTIDDVFRFLVVHLWEEGSLELMATTIGAALLASLGVVSRSRARSLAFWEAGLVLLSGLFATGHHYYWIGTPPFWQLFGAMASGVQVIPVILLAKTAWQSISSRGSPAPTGSSHRRPGYSTRRQPGKEVNPALYFFYASVFWNVAGAGILGFLLALPPLNPYAHGTYLTSAHAHMALFGFFGFLVLASSYYILTRRVELQSTHIRRVKLCLILLNAGLAVMAGALFGAGLFQSYLWRGLGRDFTVVHLQLTPYLLARSAGGVLFASGAVLLAWEMVSLVYSPWLALLQPAEGD